MRLLLIENDSFFAALIKKFLERDMPDAQLTDVLAGAGVPKTDWKIFDVLLLCHELGAAGNGLEWLDTVNTKELPPVLYFTDTGSDELASRAVKAGAAAVLRKDELSSNRVARTIKKVVKGELRAAKRREAKDPLPKPEVEGFKVASQIGKGAKSRVFLTERVTDRQTVVLKVIDLDLIKDHAYVKRFVEEAELVADIRSPYVIRVFEHGFTDHCGFMAMEFFPRGDLKHRIEVGLRVNDAVHCLANIAYGLQAIHKVGIVHRDLKPANVMFRHDDTLALADFGISQRLESDSDALATGRVLGTPHYMSPEQGRGEPVDVRNDIYSLGVMFYEMLTGDKPFCGKSPADLVYAHCNAPLPRLPSKLRRYQGVLEKLRAKDPGDRYQTATELLDDL